MTGNGTTRWKSEKALQVKREVLTTLEPLEHKPTLKEDVSVMQLSKKPNRDGGKHSKTRPVHLESLATAPNYNFVAEAVVSKV
ncbi:hypothetical protein Gpo141_00012606 [Globisporangium polare]